MRRVLHLRVRRVEQHEPAQSLSERVRRLQLRRVALSPLALVLRVDVAPESKVFVVRRVSPDDEGVILRHREDARLVKQREEDHVEPRFEDRDANRHLREREREPVQLGHLRVVPYKANVAGWSS